MNNQTDIEIYVNRLDYDEAIAWLTAAFDRVSARPKKKGMPKKAFPVTIEWQQSEFLCVIFEEVVPGYTSIWFDHNNLPWPSDEACAKEAAIFLSKPVRVTAGGWAPDTDPDAWIEIHEDGRTESIIWKTE